VTDNGVLRGLNYVPVLPCCSTGTQALWLIAGNLLQ